MYVFICEDHLEGILTGVYDACASHLGHRNIRLMTGEPDNFELFSEYITVTPSAQKAEKVIRTITERFGMQFYESIYQAAMSGETHTEQKLDKADAIYQTFYESIYQAAMSGETHTEQKLDKADAIYQTILLALSCGDGQRVLLSLGEPCVYRIFELCRATNREAHRHLEFLRFSELENGVLFAAIHPKDHVLPYIAEHFTDRLPSENFMIYHRHLEFLRFSELENGVLFAAIHPKDHVLPYIAEHFTDRLPSENFMIYDETHRTVAVHKASKQYAIVDAADLDPDKIKRYSEDETEYRRLWLAFFDHIAIDSRKNPKLQMQLMPKRFWLDPDKIKRYSEDETEYRRLWLAFFDHIAIDSRKNPKLQMQLMPKRFWSDMTEVMRFAQTG